MALDPTMLSSDLSFMVNDLPSVIVWNGTPYSVSASDDIKDGKLEVDGMIVEFDISFTCTAATFGGSVPGLKARLSYRDKTYVVVRTSLDPAGIGVILYCQSELG